MPREKSASARSAPTGRSRFHILLPDINGIFRGLSAAMDDMPSLLAEEVSWSSSLFSSRFDGAVVEESGYGLSRGDPDYPCRAVAGTRMLMPWRGDDQQSIYAMFKPDGDAFELDPQHVLAAMVRRFRDDGLRVILATEFEFYLTQDKTLMQAEGQEGMSDLYAMHEINRREAFLQRLTDAAAAQELPTGNIISEYGAGQWEVNLKHTDAETAALHGLLLRHLVHGCTTAAGKHATFMAKPYGQSSGSGMHMHISIRRDDANLFTDESRLLNAVAGVLAVINEGMAFFAPYDNSYRRFVSGGYVPLTPSWGHENRAVAVRLPRASGDDDKRLEFRLCGADVNPLLVAAVVLAGIHYGLNENLKPPAPQEKEEPRSAAQFPATWRGALDALQAATILPHYLDAAFLQNYRTVKESEWRHHRQYISDYDRLFYGRAV